MSDKSRVPNSRKGRPNGTSKHYGDRDERFALNVDPEEAIERLINAPAPVSDSTAT